jgi:hypothetical protein
MANKPKDRGRAVENWIRDKHREHGIPCERVVGSGMFGGKLTGDLCIPDVDHCKFRAESKARKNGAGFSTLEKWMGEDDIMFLKRNYQDPMVIMKFDLYLALMKLYSDKHFLCTTNQK